MKKKNGFIATSLIYSFFLVFITLFLTIIADYLQNKVLLNTIESDIKEEINKNKGLKDFLVGDLITFEAGTFASVSLTCAGVASCNVLEGSFLYKIKDFSNVEPSTDGKIDTIIFNKCEAPADPTDPPCDAISANDISITLNSYKFEVNTDTVTSAITITGVKS